LVGKTRWIPIILAKAGVLKGKKAIGPSASDEFGKAVLKKLGK